MAYGFGNGNGYDGFSMSNNARMAYNSGEMPLSKWRKSDILTAIEECLDDACVDNKDEIIVLLNKYNLNTLKGHFLEYKAWHHTSSYYNETEFYGINEMAMDDCIQDIDETKVRLDELEKYYLENKKPKKTYSDDLRYVEVIYGEWVGTRKHPKLEYYSSYAIIKGPWVYLRNGKRKKLEGLHMNISKEFNKAPKGTKSIFDEIIKSIK